MKAIKDYLLTDHNKCDELFIMMESLVDKSLSEVKDTCLEFQKETERYFQMRV